MATLQQIGSALKKAAAAGDAPAARVLAKAYKAAAVQAGTSNAGPAAPTPQAGPMDFLTQGMSGLNEGIAAGLGAPVDLATAGINLATTGIDKLTGAQIPQIEHPMGGSETFRGILAPTIKPETNDTGLQVTRRVAKEVGAMLIPGAKPVAMAAKPLEVAGKELLASLGSGAGAAVAQQAFPGNPFAEFAGQVAGGFSPMALESAAARSAPKAAPVAAMTIDDLRTAKNAAYDKTKTLGVSYSQPAYINMLSKIGQEVNADHISPTRHSAAYSFIVDMGQRAGQPMTLTELDQLRQEVRRDLITPAIGNPAKAADAHFGEIILDNIDEMIGNARPSDLIAGNAKEAANTILEARSLNTKLRKSELVQDAVEKAKLQAASSGSGGNLNNAVRQQFKAILTNPKKIRSFTAQERAAMEDLVKQGKADDFVRLLGKAAPGNNGLIGVLEILATLHNPAAAALPVAGMVAKGIADRGTLNKAQKLQDMVIGNNATPAPAPPRPPIISPQQSQIAKSLLYAQSANQNKAPLQITVRGGSVR